MADDLPNVGKPAHRALAAMKIASLADVARHSEAELLALHGFGPKAARILRQALADKGLDFKST